MEKKILLGGVLLLLANMAVAQTPSDSLHPRPNPSQAPKLKIEPFRKDQLFQKSPLKLYADALPQAQAFAGEETIIYSNMPQAKFGRKQDDLPVVKPEARVHHHLLKKKYKVLPVPKNSGVESEGLE
ncbi:hypothetical protein [Rufibacter psychrotolerans]|uniref:hypothetical protein n=1 Tax=Rufibacter psychrotolerans TaxID=2812556 RepID=UPI001967F409|nr:hypothetical protein [Rufibacter sp. SYSU D00308]